MRCPLEGDDVRMGGVQIKAMLVPGTTKITEVKPEGKLRVLILHDSARIGGAEGSLMQLARNLDRSKFDVFVVCPKEGPLVQKLRDSCVDVIPLELSHFSLKTRSSYIRYLQSLVRLWWLVKKLRIDILHCNSCRAAHWGVPLSRLLSVKTICHVRDSRYTRATQFFLKHASGTVELVAVSAAIKRAVQSVGVRETRIRVIHNAEDVRTYRPDASVNVLAREFVCTEKRFKIGIIGRIVEWKRHIDLIEAVGSLRSKIDFQVFIVGELWDEDSTLTKTLQDRILSLSLENRVIFTGFRENVREIIAGLDMVVVPSEDEPFGKVIIEAMAMSKPVIGTRSGGIPEIIEDGVSGILVPIRDPASIARAIETVALDKKFAETLGRNARNRVVASFSLEHHVANIQKLYLDGLVKQLY